MRRDGFGISVSGSLVCRSSFGWISDLVIYESNFSYGYLDYIFCFALVGFYQRQNNCAFVLQFTLRRYYEFTRVIRRKKSKAAEVDLLIRHGLIINLKSNREFFRVDDFNHFHLHKAIALGVFMLAERLHHTEAIQIQVIQFFVVAHGVSLVSFAVNQIERLARTRSQRNSGEANKDAQLLQHRWHGIERMPAGMGRMPGGILNIVFIPT